MIPVLEALKRLLVYIKSELKSCESVTALTPGSPCPSRLCLQTADLGLDIGAQGEPLGYRPDGKSPSAGFRGSKWGGGWGSFQESHGRQRRRSVVCTRPH